MSKAFLNGRPASTDDLRALALSNYGHFTVMQMRARAVQGLEFHIARLQQATGELFGCELSRERILDSLRMALDADSATDGGLRVTVYARSFDYRRPAQVLSPDLLVTLSPPSPADKPPIRVCSYPFVRPLPHIKHVGTFPLFHYRRQALRAGFDDALFVTQEGWISEGSTWNIGFWDGGQVVWPEAPALRGSCEWLIRDGLDAVGIPQRARPVRLDETAGFRAAFAANASGIQPVGGIDGVDYGVDGDLMARLASALASRPWQPLEEAPIPSL